MILAPGENKSRYLSIGSAGAVGAVTMMWAGWLYPMFFQVGTLLLVICLIPLASVLQARGGVMLGMLFGMVWLAARFGMTGTLEQDLLFSHANIIALLAMMGVGGLSGVLLNTNTDHSTSLPQQKGQENAVHLEPLQTNSIHAPEMLPSNWRESLMRHREWMKEWDRNQESWTSFGVHLREFLQMLTGAKRIRCFRVGENGQLYPLSQYESDTAVSTEQDGLLSHVLTTGRRFLASSESTPPMIRELAEGTSNPPEWVLPVFYQNRPIGLVTVDQFEEPQDEQHLQLAGDMVEEFWQHVYQADHLRIAHLKDRASGVLNRVEFMCLLDDMVQRSYEAYEPVVIMVICLEGLRGLDDEGQWEKRDGVIESVGQVICAGVRKDDIVGRFSDSVFVAVLRRLDTSLAELICKKLMVQVQQSIANREAEPFVTLRAGLAGSGLEQVPAEELMLQAFSALQSARQEQKTLKTVTAKKDTPEESS